MGSTLASLKPRLTSTLGSAFFNSAAPFSVTPLCHAYTLRRNFMFLRLARPASVTLVL